MPINWDTVRAEHVKRACELLISGEGELKGRAKNLFVEYQEHSLPAKQVLRLSYLFANRLPLDTTLKFASGDGTMSRLQGLGFTVRRVGESNTVQHAQ